MLKKIARIFVVLIIFGALVRPALAVDKKVPIYFFWSKICSHCAKEKVFLASLEKKYDRVKIEDFEITGNRENLVLLKKIGIELQIDVSGVPFTAVGKYHFSGFLSDETTGRQIEEAVQCALENGCTDIVGDIINSEKGIAQSENRTIPETLDLPLIGKIKTKNFSLPAFTFVIALLDGFNPCAMWVLLFLISLLLGMKDKKKMWLLGTVFILASAFVYFLFMSAWLNLFLFLGFVFWVRILIGLAALGAGSYSLRDYWASREGGCEAVGDKKRERIFSRAKKIVQEKKLILALVGMALLAFGVNLIELVCSAGLPAIYTQILTLTKLSKWQYYLYLAFYVLIFMFDDLFVFFVAMVTLQAVGIQSKYARWSRLAGGLLMLLIGLLLLFKPEFLMFG